MYLSVLETPFFRGMIEEKDRERVESLFAERRYPKGQILFFQGDESHEMYIVKSGILKIYLQRDEHEIILGHQFPGEVIGELEMFHYDNRRTASVAVIEPAELWMIKRSDLMELTRQYPEIMRKVIYVLSERLIQADRPWLPLSISSVQFYTTTRDYNKAKGSELLPVMQTDMTLRQGGNTLIIDTKYYSRMTRERFDRRTLHSGNLYQIFTYVKNQDKHGMGNVAGMLLYARTDEAFVPDCAFTISGNKIMIKMLDLNREFAVQLDGIAESVRRSSRSGIP